MIIVSSFDNAPDAFKKFGPEYVVSILGGDEGPVPAFNGLAPDHHVIIRDDCSSIDPSKSKCQSLLRLAADWDKKAPVLIHCQEGACRSMAAAYILLCAVESETCEAEIAARLRQAAPHADPNMLLISEADSLLGRNDRMVEAILDMCPSAGADACDIVTLPLAA